MTERRSITCNACKGEIVPGVLYCWRHANSAPKVGQIIVSHGQLVWRTTDECAGRQERAIAVLLDGLQLEVRNADEVQQPARVNLDLGDPNHPAGAATIAYVSLAAVLDALVNGDEQIEASRHA